MKNAGVGVDGLFNQEVFQKQSSIEELEAALVRFSDARFILNEAIGKIEHLDRDRHAFESLIYDCDSWCKSLKFMIDHERKKLNASEGIEESSTVVSFL